MELSDKERFLLHYLKNRQIKLGLDEPVKTLFAHCGQTIQNLKLAGYLTNDDHSYFLETKSIPELKTILNGLSLSVTGKKQDLIERIKKHTSEVQREKICPDLYYVFTEKGTIEDDKFNTQQRQHGKQLKENILSFINQGDYKGAVFYMCEAYSQEIIPPGVGTDWGNKEQIWNNQQKMLNQLQEIDWEDLNNSEEFKHILIKCLYYDWLIEHELWKSIDLFINNTDELLNCESLSVFFKHNKYEPSESQKWYTYLATKRYNLYQKNMQETLKNPAYKFLLPGEFSVDKITIDRWKEYREYELLTLKNIDGFPRTFQTFLKYKLHNNDKYKKWIVSLN